jgi:hypothetical protein
LSEVFSASIEMIMKFCPLFCLCVVLCSLIFICWNIYASLDWNQFGHCVWSFKYVVEFSSQVFYWEFLYLCSQRRLVYIFFCLFLSILVIRLILVLGNEYGSSPPLTISRSSLRSIGVSSSLKVWWNLVMSHLGPGLLSVGILFITVLITSLVVDLLGGLYPPAQFC